MAILAYGHFDVSVSVVAILAAILDIHTSDAIETHSLRDLAYS